MLRREREYFGSKEAIRFYDDRDKTTELLRIVKARQRLVPRSTYDVTQPDGTKIGMIHKGFFMGRQYHVSDASDTELMVAMDDSKLVPVKQMLPRMLSGSPLMIDRLVFWRDDRQIGSHECSPWPQTDCMVDMTPDSQRIIDRRLAVAVSCFDVLRLRAGRGE